MSIKELRGLAFSGGLLKVVTLVGATKALEEKHVGLQDLLVTAGTSSGAILAVLVAMRWTAEELRRTLIQETHVVGDMLHEDPLRLGMVTILWRLYKRRGIDSGHKLYSYLGRLIAKHGDDEDMTFAEMFERYGRDALVTACCYSRTRLHVRSRHSASPTVANGHRRYFAGKRRPTCPSELPCEPLAATPAYWNPLRLEAMCILMVGSFAITHCE